MENLSVWKRRESAGNPGSLLLCTHPGLQYREGDSGHTIVIKRRPKWYGPEERSGGSATEVPVLNQYPTLLPSAISQVSVLLFLQNQLGSALTWSYKYW